MENRNVKKYLYDIKQSIDSINEYLGENRNFFAYQENKQLRRAVERELEIIGEAVNKALVIQPDLSDSIAEARRIVDLRNFVIHGYDKIDDVIIWGVVSKDLPLLETQIEKLLELYRVKGQPSG